MPEALASAAGQIERSALRPMDEEAFRAFYERTARDVLVYLTRLTSDRTLADDLLQETYYRFFRAAASHESESHRRNSLFLIATNAARDAMRRRVIIRDVPLPEDDSGQAIEARRPEGDLAADRTDLQRVMKQLKPAQREMLWLAYGEGSSHAEIAEVLGVKAASVKLLLFRARKKAAELLRGNRPQGKGE